MMAYNRSQAQVVTGVGSSVQCSRLPVQAGKTPELSLSLSLSLPASLSLSPSLSLSLCGQKGVNCQVHSGSETPLKMNPVNVFTH